MPPGGADDRYYLGRDGYYNYNDDASNDNYQPYYPGAEGKGAAATPPIAATASSSRADLIPPTRKPVPTVRTATSAIGGSSAAAADQVSPLEVTRRDGLTRNQSINATLSPQRVGTVSSGGRHTVSPASSIHQENDDIDNDNDAGRQQQHSQQHYVAYVGGGLTPSPPHHQDAAQKNWHAAPQQAQYQGWPQQQQSLDASVPRTMVPQDQSQQTQWYFDNNNNNPLAQHPVQPIVDWPAVQPEPPAGNADNVSDDDEIPHPLPQPWRGSRDLEELAMARVRAAQPGKPPIRTSYGPNASPPPPAPPPKSPPILAAAAASRAQSINTRPTIVTIPPASPPASGQTHHQRPKHHGRTVSAPTTRQRAGGRGPFMHYEDLDYFNPGPEAGSTPEQAKDESQVGIAPARADTFPDETPIDDDGLKRKERKRAKKQWDRQQRKRNKAIREGGSGGCAAFLNYCTHWLPELFCWLLSLLCFVAIVVVLKVYDGRELSDWPLAVSLNTLVAFLTAICQVALAIPLSEGISQLKWNSFARGDKPLADFQTFEDAKRGPVGSAKLLLKRKGRVLGMSAAFAMFTSFLLSPLTQAAITYPSRSILTVGAATVPKTESYAHQQPYTRLDPLEKQAIQLGLLQPPSSPISPLQPSCSTGSCSFSNFSSLAICSSTSDISNRLSLSNPTGTPCNASLPNGVFLFSTNPLTPFLNISSSKTNSTSFLPTTSILSITFDQGRLSSGIANFFLIYSTGGINTTFKASEVLFHFCVNTYSISVLDGVSTTEIVHSSSLFSDDGTLSRRQQQQDTYQVNREDVSILNKYLVSIFRGTFSNQSGISTSLLSETFGLSLFSSSSDSPLQTSEEVITNITSNIATSLSNTIRSSSSSSSSSNIINGTAQTSSQHIHIIWPFLSFLGLQIFLVSIFLLGIMVQTAVWDVVILKGGDGLQGLMSLSFEDKKKLEEEEQEESDEKKSGKRNEKEKLKGVRARFVRKGSSGSGGGNQWGLEVCKDETIGGAGRGEAG
ncbi:hypothetical protein QBC38DRAFT_356708 [Podospora fimiseda]|uniref:Uncharacterized protein n=1 Tax=Podospora fimiseda TaxID=252190 RepID=A0AAN7BX70_9PEZI|nr:hypothetical protein QBC38DRAFT_356708 [Podospora fimiseda]